MQTVTFNGQKFGNVGFFCGPDLFEVDAIVEISQPKRFGVILKVISQTVSADGYDVQKILRCQDIETGEIFEAEYNNDLRAEVEGYEVNNLWLPPEQAKRYYENK